LCYAFKRFAVDGQIKGRLYFTQLTHRNAAIILILSFFSAAYNQETGDRNRNAHQAQAKVHGNDSLITFFYYENRKLGDGLGEMESVCTSN
jgi:hypothetical protein